MQPLISSECTVITRQGSYHAKQVSDDSFIHPLRAPSPTLMYFAPFFGLKFLNLMRRQFRSLEMGIIEFYGALPASSYCSYTLVRRDMLKLHTSTSRRVSWGIENYPLLVLDYSEWLFCISNIFDIRISRWKFNGDI